MVTSCASPCIQGLSDSVAAATMAVIINNQLASTHRAIWRFCGFSALSMHNATEAALELQRAVTDLGMFSVFLGVKPAVKSLSGALLKNYRQSGSDGGKLHSACIC
jgi:2,3-dihydroxybenzoate decarboxylase